jgi:hypothetical protein
MRVLRCAWPLAGALFVTLASADIASAGPAPGAPTPDQVAAGQTDGTSFQLFGRTWCFGRAPHAVPCDYTVPAAEANKSPTAQVASDRPLERVMTALRRLFTGSPDARQTDGHG